MKAWKFKHSRATQFNQACALNRSHHRLMAMAASCRATKDLPRMRRLAAEGAKNTAAACKSASKLSRWALQATPQRRKSDRVKNREARSKAICSPAQGYALDVWCDLRYE